MPSEKPLISMVMDEVLLKRVDDFRFEYRFTSRAATIKWLLGYALDRKPIPQND